MRHIPYAAAFGGVLWGVLAACCASALAAPVLDADLRGKKICWNTGNAVAYNKDGSLNSSRFGHGTWRLTGDMLTVTAEHASYALTITKDGGTFHALEGRSEYFGNYCN